MESTTDDALKARFLAVRKEIHNRYTDKQWNEQKTASETLKRSMTDREWESEVIEIDTDITAPDESKKTNHTVTDKLIKKSSHEDFVSAFSSTDGTDTILPRRTTWTAKILPATDHRQQQEAMRVMTPLYKEMVLLSRP